MVGPLSSEEIEDVVSSVRRLVSNELQARAPSRDLDSDRLILTAALRVVPETGPLAPLVLDAPLVEPASEAAPAGDAGFAAADPDAPADAVVPPQADRPQTFQAETAEDCPADEASATHGDTAAAAEGIADAAPEDAAGVWEDDVWVRPPPVSLGEIALASEEAEILTDSVVPDTIPGDSGAAGPAGDAGQAQPSGSSVDDALAVVPLRPRAEHPTAPRLVTGDRAAEALAANPAPSPGAGAGAGAGGTEFVDADGMPLAVLDEAALQEIVRQTLRAELRGELGERITRNIRKLVRAEINRAFVARDLD